MRLRVVLLSGMAIGYVLGARAGRERYEQIQRGVGALRRSQPAQQLSAEVRNVKSRASQRIEAKAADTVSKVTSRLRGRMSSSYGARNSRVPSSTAST
jgi:hypothetical protein